MGKGLTPEQRAEKLAAVHERLGEAVEGLVTSDDWRRYLASMARFHTYSPMNSLLIMAARPDATRVAGYRTWAAMGRQVRRGSKGIAILAPMVGKTEDPTTGDEVRRVFGFRAVSVFAYEDTDGDPLPEMPRAPKLLTGDAPAAMWTSLAAQVAELGFTLRVVDVIGSSGGPNGDTNFQTRTVRIATEGRDRASQARTLAHELAHALMHETRTTEDRTRLEVEAESVAFLVADAFGLDSMEYSLGYVAAWSKGDAGTVLATAEAVQKTAGAILAAAELRAAASSEPLAACGGPV
jgi:antirestriction protein ArdC